MGAQDRTIDRHVWTPSGGWRLFTCLVVLGVGGILGGVPVNAELLAQAAPHEPLGQLLAVTSVALLVQVTLCALAFVALGHRVGLDAPVLRAVLSGQPWWPTLRAGLSSALGLAAAAFTIVLLLDLTVFDSVRRSIDAPAISLGAHLAASLYGGIVEELLVRAGFMTFIAWALAAATRQHRGTAPAWVAWASIIAATLVFGALHLPATAVLVGLSPLAVARALLLNAPFGMAFGWLTWRRGLETAIASHIAADVLLITTQHLIG